MPPRWIRFTSAEQLRRWAGRARRRRRRRDLDHPFDVLALDEERVPVRDQVQDDRETEPPVRRAGQVDPAHEDHQRAGDRQGEADRVDETGRDGLRDPRGEVRVLRLGAAHRPDDREREGRPERDDRAQHVQEQEPREQRVPVHRRPPLDGDLRDGRGQDSPPVGAQAAIRRRDGRSGNALGRGDRRSRPGRTRRGRSGVA